MCVKLIGILKIKNIESKIKIIIKLKPDLHSFYVLFFLAKTNLIFYEPLSMYQLMKQNQFYSKIYKIYNIRIYLTHNFYRPPPRFSQKIIVEEQKKININLDPSLPQPLLSIWALHIQTRKYVYTITSLVKYLSKIILVDIFVYISKIKFFHVI